ncbi:unnamed protein product [Mytilus coruscus]|uniref:Uncharacterized protein n=1 Tax=Mytilus coruscus TaxID=42192 RepID=A0A6J8BNQ1_MYTCO|nr:unnamed protein product [Mytilus coruscus]
MVNLVAINDLENADVADFRLLIDRETYFKFIIEKSTCRDPFPKLSECFEKLDKIQIISPCNNFLTNFSTFAFRFEFKERNIPSLLLCDVNYYWKSDINGNCSHSIYSNTNVPAVYYYRSKENVYANHHLNWMENDTRFFNVGDLLMSDIYGRPAFPEASVKAELCQISIKKIRLNCAT